MPTWERIEDASSDLARVWLSRIKDEDDWKPLRKVDCQALNASNDQLVHIEGGRATADVRNNMVRYNFYNSEPRKLTSATWFVREEKSSKDFTLTPVEEEDASIIESFYRSVVEATSSLGKGLDSIIDEERELPSDAKYKVVISKKNDGILSMKKKPQGWFGNSFDLQRGYSEYSVNGEEEEVMLGPVRHLIFVVHGIGQAFINRETVNMMSMIEEMDATRMAMQKLQVADWKKACEKAKKDEQPVPSPPNRVEILPIEWWDKIHNSSSALVSSLKLTTLPTVPGLRAIANDVVFDVLMYMTPVFCETVLECVTDQINDLYHGFQKVHPHFKKDGGKFSLIGHSLGSVIVWDLLSILKDQTESSSKSGQKCQTSAFSDIFCGVNLPNDGISVGYQAYAAKKEGQKVNDIKDAAWGPSLPKPMKKCIPFIPDFTIFLGSPLGMFLTLRGAHSLFQEMLHLSVLEVHAKAAEAAAAEATTNSDSVKDKNNKQQKRDSEDFEVPITSPFTLPSKAIYNIFHPSDPVAYRIEPLLLAREQAKTPPPPYVTKKGQKLRLHLQVQQIGDGFVRSLGDKGRSVKGFFSAITEQAVTALKNIGDSNSDDDTIRSKHSADTLKPGPLRFALGGKSRRVDFCLQPGVIENEYLSAVSAHSNYFINQDLFDFILDLTSSTPSPVPNNEEVL
mmetsp:Transcript_19519/g.28934  ORF Transcript_19519/g.28934 Transcript_19519/m.28934 type:complete len:680 (-) Transcript_19519:102-2141(-)